MFCRMACLLIWLFVVQLSLYRLVALVYIPLPFQWANLGTTVYVSLQRETRVCRIPTDMNRGRALSCTQLWQVRNETGVYVSEGTACSLVDRGHRTILTCLNGQWNKAPSKMDSGHFSFLCSPKSDDHSRCGLGDDLHSTLSSFSLATLILLSAD